MSTRPETFVPLIHCIIDYTLYLAMPDFCRTLLQFTDVMNLMSVAKVSMHTSMPKEDILAFTETHEYTHNYIYLVNFVNDKAKWRYCVRILLFFRRCFSQGSVVVGVMGNIITRISWQNYCWVQQWRNLKIGEHLSKLWMNIEWHVFMAHGV